MKRSKLARVAFAFGISAACLAGLSGCSNGDASASSNGAVAATIEGTTVSEDEVTAYVESLRAQRGLEDEDSWGNYLAQSKMTPSDVRQYVIDTYTQRELIKKGADEKGITVDSSEVDSYVEKTKSNYDTDEKWQSALTQAGMTEDEYRSEIELQLKAKYLYESFATDEEPSEDDVLSYAQMYATAYDGAKRSSHILFNADDEATAQDVLNKINSGELDFVEAVKQYSTDSASAEQDGDVGWDKTTSLDSDYQTALDGLQKDQISGLVTSQFGIHIIKCTDVYTAPKEADDSGNETVKITSTDQIPAEWLDSIKSSLKSSKQSEAYQQWLEQEKEGADIQVNDMPSGLSYDVDMSKYQTSDDSSDTGESGASDQGTTDGQDANADQPAEGDQASGDNAQSDEQGESSSDDQRSAEAA